MGHVAVVLAAGQGTRMRSALPKVLHPLAGRPMLAWVLDAVAETKPDRVVVVVGHGADQVRPTIPEGVESCEQTAQLGTGHATAVALDHLGPLADGAPVLVVPGDTPLVGGETLQALLDAHATGGASLSMLSAVVPDAHGYGRVVRFGDGTVERIVEQADTDATTASIDEINAGMYVFDVVGLRRDLDAVTTENAQGEYYLTDLVGIATRRGDRVVAHRVEPMLVSGVNTHTHLAAAAAVLRGRIAERWMEAGVRMTDPTAVYIDAGVDLAPGVVIHPGVHLQGATRVGEGAVIGPDVHVTDSTIGDGSHVWYAVIRQSEIGEACEIGPYASLRPGTVLERGVKIGTYVETKKTVVGEGTKIPHLSYMGDATIGSGSNIGAGTITCNYDGFAKHPTVIGDRAFIGSDTMLVAPVRIGDGAMTAAGSTITEDVEPGALGVARGRQRNVPGFVQRMADRYRARRSEDAPD